MTQRRICCLPALLLAATTASAVETIDVKGLHFDLLAAAAVEVTYRTPDPERDQRQVWGTADKAKRIVDHLTLHYRNLTISVPSELLIELTVIATDSVEIHAATADKYELKFGGGDAAGAYSAVVAVNGKRGRRYVEHGEFREQACESLSVHNGWLTDYSMHSGFDDQK